MKDFQQRVVNECNELDERLEKLLIFLDGDLFKSLPSEEHLRLRRQCAAMKDYSQVLKERIVAFSDCSE